jgi:hypothetical protein
VRSHLALERHHHAWNAYASYGDGPFPAVVLVAGSSPSDRYWCSPLLSGSNGSGRLFAKGISGRCNRSDLSGDVWDSSGGVGLVCEIFRGIFERNHAVLRFLARDLHQQSVIDGLDREGPNVTGFVDSNAPDSLIGAMSLPCQYAW